jgi:hypothetical protein
MASAEDWQSLVPPAVVRVIERLRQSTPTL